MRCKPCNTRHGLATQLRDGWNVDLYEWALNATTTTMMIIGTGVGGWITDTHCTGLRVRQQDIDQTIEKMMEGQQALRAWWKWFFDCIPKGAIIIVGHIPCFRSGSVPARLCMISRRIHFCINPQHHTHTCRHETDPSWVLYTPVPRIRLQIESLYGYMMHVIGVGFDKTRNLSRLRLKTKEVDNSIFSENSSAKLSVAVTTTTTTCCREISMNQIWAGFSWHLSRQKQCAMLYLLPINNRNFAAINHHDMLV